MNRLPIALVACSLIALGLVILPTAPAEACSPPRCEGGHLLPDGEPIPANAKALLWTPRKRYGAGLTEIDESDVELLEESGGDWINVDFSLEPHQWRQAFLVRPDEPLAEDGTYELRTTNLCDDADSTFALHTGATAEQPGELGQLVADEPFEDDLRVAASGGMCTLTLAAAQVPVSIELSQEAEPWAGLFEYTTFVRATDEEDATVWRASSSSVGDIPPGESWKGHGEELLYTLCESNERSNDRPREGLEEGTYEVYMHATMPGTDVALESDPVTVELECDNGASGGDAGHDAGTDAGNDAGTDAGGDTGGDAGRELGFDSENESSSASCNQSGGPASVDLSILLLAASALVWRRRSLL